MLDSKQTFKNIRNLLRVNKSKGFDCPGCAWGDNNGTLSFCENSAKAVSWEATRKAVDATFFARHTVSSLYQQSNYFLEYQWQLTESLRYNSESDKYLPIRWEDIFAIIVNHLQDLAHPDQLELYTSGRASNEASYLYQLFGRMFGTNNFPDCSNMCHEASGSGLKQSIGIGKGTARLNDFELVDAIFVFGQHLDTKHPRMLHSLCHAADHGASIVSFNNLRERRLERFADPQKPLEVITPKAERISSRYLQPNLRGDMAAVRSIVVKALLENYRQPFGVREGRHFR